MARFLVYVLASCAVLAAALVSSAQQSNPCAADIERFCAHLRPGRGIIADCLKKNEAQLSPECRAQHLAEISEALKNTQEACEEDSVKFCGSYLQQPGIRLLECLKMNAAGLSPVCKKRLFEALEEMHY